MKSAKEYIKEIEEGLAEFGRYTYYDKGANEVVEVPSYKDFKDHPPEEIKKVLKEILQHEHGEPFVSAILYNLQDYDSIIEPLLEDDELSAAF